MLRSKLRLREVAGDPGNRTLEPPPFTVPPCSQLYIQEAVAVLGAHMDYGIPISEGQVKSSS